MGKIIPILLLWFLISSCSIGLSNSKDDLFEKNKECLKMVDTSLKHFWLGEDIFIQNIFYSPSKNTCIIWFKKGSFHSLMNLFTFEYILEFVTELELYNTTMKELKK